MCKVNIMKSFIGNPFEAEYEDDDDLEMEIEPIDNIMNAFGLGNRFIIPSEDEDDNLGTNVLFFGDSDMADDSDDPDYEIDDDEEDNYSDEINTFNFTESEGEQQSLSSPQRSDRLSQYVLSFSSDDDEIDYVTYPLRNDAVDNEASNVNANDTKESTEASSDVTSSSQVDNNVQPDSTTVSTEKKNV